MTTSRPRDPRTAHNILLQILGRLARVAIGLGLMFGLWCYFFISHRSALPPPTPEATEQTAAKHAETTKAVPETKADDPPAEKPGGSVEQRTAFTADEITRNIAKAEQGRVVQRANEAKLILEEARRLSGRFESVITALKSDDQGRRIATRPELVGRYRALAAMRRTPAGRIGGALADLDSLSRPLRRALSDPDDITMPTDPIRQKLAEMTSFAGTIREEYTRLDSELEALLADVRTVSDAGSIPLADAIAHLEDSEAREASRLASEAMETARKEAARKRAEAEAEAIRLAGEAEAAEDRLEGAGEERSRGRGICRPSGKPPRRSGSGRRRGLPRSHTTSVPFSPRARSSRRRSMGRSSPSSPRPSRARSRSRG